MEAVKTTTVKCPVEGCGKEYKNNAGLSSHMAMEHRLKVNGEPLPEGSVEERKKHQSVSQTKRLKEISRTGQDIAYLRDPEIRKKAAATNRERKMKKLAEQGIYRCPECAETKRYLDFDSPRALGRHRQAAHGIEGAQHAKTAASQSVFEAALAERQPKQLSATQQAKSLPPRPIGRPKNPRPPIPQLPFQCDACSKTFKTQHGLSIHIAQAHKISTETALTPSTSQELIHVNARTQRSAAAPVLNGHTETRRSHPDDAAIAEAIAVADAVGNIKGFLGHAADEHDVAPRQFARRVILALSEHYST
jgi:hypothetical protein